ncbi:MAG: hypothetical protein LBR61_01050 [Synergistaceae bacterium]|jgi:hypothetical protein|nr:hypothetical protein [Synergistaceae bacterium]
MLKEYFGRPAFFATVLIGVPMLVLLSFAGGTLCSVFSLYSGIATETLPGRTFLFDLNSAAWRTTAAFAVFVIARTLFLTLRVPWSLLFSQAAAAFGTYLLIRGLYAMLGTFSLALSLWSVVTFVAFLSAFDSLEPARAERWHGFFRFMLGMFPGGRPRWRR